MKRFGGMNKEAGRAGGGHGGRHFSADMPGFSHARQDHVSFTFQHHFQGDGVLTGVKLLRQRG